MLLLDLMSLEELEETIDLLRTKLNDTAVVYGRHSSRTIEISRSLDLYIARYIKLKKKKID